MEKNSSFTHKDLWNQVFQFLDMCDYHALELCNRNFKNILNNYYLLMTKNMTNSSFHKNPKKLFFSIFKNSFVIYNVKDEYNSLEETEQFKSSNGEVSDNKKSRKLSTPFVENSQSIQTSQENSLFCQG
jgi:hypothetical protein